MRLLTVVLLAATFAASLAACNRKVEVGSAPSPASGMAVNLTNNSSQPVNAYVTSGGADVFIGQVPPNSVKMLTVTGVASGRSVTLKARPGAVFQPTNPSYSNPYSRRKRDIYYR